MKIETITVGTPGAVRPGDYLVLDKPSSTVSGTVRTVKMNEIILEGGICVRMDAWAHITVTRDVHVAEKNDVGYATVRGVHNIKVMKTRPFRDSEGRTWEWVSEPFQTHYSPTQYTMHPNQDVTNFRPDADHKCTPLPSTAPTIQGKDIRTWYKTAQHAIQEAGRWKEASREKDLKHLEMEVKRLEVRVRTARDERDMARKEGERHKVEVERLRGKLAEHEHGFEIQLKQTYGEPDHVTVKKDGSTISRGYVRSDVFASGQLHIPPEVVVGNLTHAAIQREMQVNGLGYEAAKRATTALLDLMTGKTR